jgi:hypothetical protein
MEGGSVRPEMALQYTTVSPTVELSDTKLDFNTVLGVVPNVGPL